MNTIRSTTHAMYETLSYMTPKKFTVHKETTEGFVTLSEQRSKLDAWAQLGRNDINDAQEAVRRILVVIEKSKGKSSIMPLQLNLEGLAISTYPPCVPDNLTELILSKTNISELPEDLAAQLPLLEMLSIGNTPIEELPDFSGHKTLRYLIMNSEAARYVNDEIVTIFPRNL